MLLLKIFTTLSLVVFYLVGSRITIPYVSSALDMSSQSLFGSSASTFIAAQQDNASLVSLGIGPYITSSLLFGLLFQTSPYFKRKKKYGDPKITQRYTKWATLPIALFQGVIFCHSILKQHVKLGNIIYGFNIYSWYSKIVFICLSTLTLTTFSLLMVWLSDLCTEHGLSSGSSVFIATSILARAKRDWELIIACGHPYLTVGLWLILVGFIVFVENTYRNLSVVYPRGRERGGFSQDVRTVLPIKLNPAGVMPIVFSSRAMSGLAALTWILKAPIFTYLLYSIPSTWMFRFKQLKPILMFGLIGVSSYVYQIIYGESNIKNFSQYIHKRAGFIVGVRPGNYTRDYLKKVVDKYIPLGVIYLIFASSFTSLIGNLLGIHMIGMFSGSSALIYVIIASDIAQNILTSLAVYLQSKGPTVGKILL